MENLVRLSPGEASLLLQMAAHARMSSAGPQWDESRLSGSKKTAAARLAKKGLVERTPQNSYRVTPAGFTRVKAIY